MAYKGNGIIEEWSRAEFEDRWRESMYLPGVDGRWKMVTYVGRLGTKKLYQADHQWVFGE